MGITCNIDFAGWGSRLQQLEASIDEEIVKHLQAIAENAVTHAREAHAKDWLDQTGNLRSSIGFVFFKDGKPIAQSSFEQVPAKKPRKGASYNGGRKGLDLALQIDDADKDRYTVKVVAGMNYAIHVESKGYDVLTSAEQQVSKEIQQQMKAIGEALSKALAEFWRQFAKSTFK